MDCGREMLDRVKILFGSGNRVNGGASFRDWEILREEQV